MSYADRRCESQKSVKTRPPLARAEGRRVPKKCRRERRSVGERFGASNGDSPMSEAETAPLHSSKRGRRGSPRPRLALADPDPAYGGGPPGGPQGRARPGGPGFSLLRPM